MRTRVVLSAAVSAIALMQLAPGRAQAQTPVISPETEEASEVEEVVVTAAPFAVAEDALTANTEVVSRDELDIAPAQTLGDLLSGIPGLRSTFFGPGASRPVVRGLAGPRVQVLTNGIGAIDVSQISPDHQVATDPGEAERIEVLRGTSTILYGGSAIGGVINVIDARVPTKGATGLVDGRFSAQGSSVDNGRSASGAVKVGEGPFVFTFDALSRRADDYDIPGPQISQRLADALGVEREGDGKVANSFVDLDQIGAGASYVFDRGFFGAAIKRTQSNYGTVAEEEVTIDLEQTRVDVRGELDVDLGIFETVRLTSAFGDYSHTEFEGEEVGTQFLTEGYEGRLELVQRERNGLSGAVGVQGLTREFVAVGEEAYVPATDITEIAAFTLQRLDRDAYGLEGGLRVDRRELDSEAGQRQFTSVSASGGVFFRPQRGVFLGLSVARNERAPNEVELFASGPHVATGTFEIGDPSFDKEVAYSLEGAAHYDAGRFAADLHVFNVKYDGFIDARPTGEIEDDLPVFVYRQTRANFYGAEAEASYAFFREGRGESRRELRIEGQYDYVRGDTDVGAPARIPSYSATARLVYESPTFDGRVEARRVGEQERVAEFELPTDGYTLVNAYAAFKPATLNGVTLFAEARNVGDEEAREHTSFLKDIAPLPGRNFRAGVALTF